MLERRFRFHGQGGLRWLYRKGRSVSNQHMSLKYSRNASRVHSRFTVVVTKKVYKAAAKRNRIRRRVYEIVRRHWQQIEAPYDIALTVRDPLALVMPPEELSQAVLGLLASARLLKNQQVEGGLK
ncbi:MAG: ribonuclease P protein component [Candidatus Chaera renei]|uniref:Ribonuclease P protein component n=1 Tax=Candidatus Chaera renei TaxID=2506947 RepID=A0A4Q0AJA2_9BACT|nr:MAG: ribonuclease P protein component [Candidatus Chaera renei]